MSITISPVGSPFETDGNNITTLTVHPTATGDILVVGVYAGVVDGNLITSVSGGGVTTWNKLVQGPLQSGHNDIEMWWGIITSTGVSNITFTYQTALSGTGTQDYIAQQFTFTGGTGTWAVDGTPTIQDNNSSSTNTPFPTLIPAAAGELYVGLGVPQGSSVATGGGATGTSGYTFDITTYQNNFCYNAACTSAAQSPVGTQSPSAASTTAGALIKVTPTGVSFTGSGAVVFAGSGTMTTKVNFSGTGAISFAGTANFGALYGGGSMTFSGSGTFIVVTILKNFVQSATAQGLVLTDYDFADRYMAWLPDFYLELDAQNPAQYLQQFLAMLGYETDWIRSEIESLFLLTDVDLISGALLPALSAQLGITYEPELGMTRSRVLAKNATLMYKTRGTLGGSLPGGVGGLGATASAFSGYACEASIGKNLEIQLDDAAFDGAAANYQPPLNTSQPSGTYGHWLYNTACTITSVSAASMGVNPAHTAYNPANNVNVGLITAVEQATPSPISISTCSIANAVNIGIPIPQNVSPVPTYVLSASFQPVSTLRSFYAQIDWYAFNGAYISSSTGTPVAEITGQWVRPYVVATPPAGARFFGRTFKTTAACANAEQHMIDAVQSEVNTQATPGPSVWDPPRDIKLSLAPVRQNLFPNSNGLLGISGWTAQNALITNILGGMTVWPAETQSGFQITQTRGTIIGASSDPILVIPEIAYTFSGYFNAVTVARQVIFSIEFYDIHGNLLQTDNGLSFNDQVGSFVRVAIADAVAPANAYTAVATFQISAVGAGEQHLYGALLFEPSAYVNPYFNGSSQPGTDYIWQGGLPNQSISDYYPAFGLKLARLVTAMPDFIPIGSTFSLITAATDFIGFPVVSAVTPNEGPTAGGTIVVLTGANLANATAVTFGTVPATQYVINSDTSIQVTIPAGAAGIVNVEVTTAGGRSSAGLGNQFTYTAAPVVTGVSPPSGIASGGTTVKISGFNFTGATAVKFGSTNAIYNVNSDSSITATAPAGAGIVDITVTTSNGTSATSSADQFTYTSVSVPTVIAVTQYGPTAGGNVVTIVGTNFSGATAVHFGSTLVTSGLNIISSSEIQVSAPAGAAGAVDITVTNSFGTSALSSADKYTYVGPPGISSVNPSSGPPGLQTVVQITGVNFVNVSSVEFGGAAAVSYTVNSPTSITATAPGQPSGVVDIVITAVGGTSSLSNADKFTYLSQAVPVVSSVSPTTGSTTGGTTVIIKGTGFTGVTQVLFGTVPAQSFHVDSDTQITAVTPAE